VTSETDGTDATADRARGEQAWRDVMGWDGPPVTDPFMEFTTDHVFGRVWTRPGLAVRDRRLTTLSVIAMTGQRDPLVYHLGAAYRSGDFTLEELEEWVLHLAHYAGWPIASTAHSALHEVRAAAAGDA
jgi:4-carboxymuconolactone decarboxylase